jgi:alpha-L-rhamnosidase
VIYLGGTSQQMTLRVLKRLDTLVKGGATLVGKKPIGSPSLSDDPAEFTRVADALWADNTGHVIQSADINNALALRKIAPDFGYTKSQANTTLMFVHRQTTDADIYYFTNRKDRTEATTLQFNVNGKIPELWDAATGLSHGVGFDIRGGQTVIPITLRPYQSGYVVFRKPAGGVDGTAAGTIKSNTLQSLSTNWTLSFQRDRGAPGSINMPILTDWSKNGDPRIKYFSGIGTYMKEINIPAAALGGGKAVFVNLGEVNDLAEVFVNGKSAGIAWKAPYRVDISSIARAGKNKLEISVANLWVNRLIGDAQPGAKPITFTTLKTYTKDAPLRPSGLLGPVTLEAEQR